MSKESNKSIIIWLLSGCFLIAAMVVIGGITRLTHSGLSMVEWKLIMGSIPPLNEQEWIETFEKYKQFPEYQVMHYYFTLEDFKSIFMWEYVHRLLGRIIGLVFIIPFVYFLIKKKISKKLMPHLIVIFLWGGFQGFLGWFMVKSGLVNDPNVSHYRLAIHLVTAFGLCCYIFWVALGLSKKSGSAKTDNSFVLAGIILFIVSFIQTVYGAFVAGLKAGYIYPTWPKMSSYWLAPEISTALNDNGLVAIFEDPITVQFIHRWFAFIVLIVSIIVVHKIRKESTNKRLKSAAVFFFTVLLVQISLGILTLINSVQIGLAVAHQLVALLLLLSITNLIHYASKRQNLTKPLEA